MIDRWAIEQAIEEEKLIVRINRHWWLARRRAETKVIGNQWFVFVEGGPHRTNRMITSVDDNASGVEFRIVTKTPK